ncbi:MAG: hypothetical protein JNM60_09110 [Candidatus Competibacteraceae bacterium]|nr:hypothetical protein [Candidatus Competibacteraceae bacterium]
MTDPPRDLSQEKNQAFENAVRAAPRRPSDRQIVRELLPAIRRKREAGWSYAEIRAALAETHGFAGTLGSLYSYVSKWSNAQKKLPAPPKSPEGPPAPAPPRRIADLCGHFAQPCPKSSPPPKKRTLVETLNKPV